MVAVRAGAGEGRPHVSKTSLEAKMKVSWATVLAVDVETGRQALETLKGVKVTMLGSDWTPDNMENS